VRDIQKRKEKILPAKIAFNLMRSFLSNLSLFLLILLPLTTNAQLPSTFQWAADGKSYYDFYGGEVVRITLPEYTQEVIVSNQEMRTAGNTPLRVTGLSFSASEQKILLFANPERVWRYETRGDYWLFDLTKKSLVKIGRDRPDASLMWAKISPDETKVAYVSQNNLYVEDLRSGTSKALTTDGTSRLLNGTFDWAYEEEFDCRDGFRWSPDSKTIAYWQIDASKIRNFNMINYTDSIYSFNVPVEYPKVGEKPSSYRVGVVDVSNSKTRWMPLPGDPQNTYLPRLEFTNKANELVAQQLNRKQNESSLFYINTQTGKYSLFYQEQDEAWIEVKNVYDDAPSGWDWLTGHQEFVWISEKDGWRHAYRISRDGKREQRITSGNFDIIKPLRIDEQGNNYYFIASPNEATQAYLYRANLDGSGSAERLSPINQRGTHEYLIAPDGKKALHVFSNAGTQPVTQWITLPDHRPLFPTQPRVNPKPMHERPTFFKVTTKSGVELDGWMIKPKNFDPQKRYPIVFYVYGEPALSTVKDVFGTGFNPSYRGDMAADGYIYASIDNRGTPSPKGRAWRKAIYRNIGVTNIKDLAEGAQALFETYPFIDTDRVAVHGHSGGGSSTLNLLFQYPNTFQTGIAVAAVTNQLTYDNIYQERFMGLPQENLEDFLKGSPVTHARHLKGNLLYIHGTGDDNVHYQNAELLINELVKHERQFQFMAYPNRTHGITEGEGTANHMSALITNFLQRHCPPGAK
jgi:dipeptidyl-peptidase-4